MRLLSISMAGFACPDTWHDKAFNSCSKSRGTVNPIWLRLDDNAQFSGSASVVGSGIVSVIMRKRSMSPYCDVIA